MAESPAHELRLRQIELERQNEELRVVRQEFAAYKNAEAEKKKLEAQMAQARKLESVGRLAGGVAHHFNNLLSVILGHAELALGELGPSDPLRASLETICTAAQRSAGLTRKLLTFASKQVAQPRILDLNRTMAETLGILRQLLGAEINLCFNPGQNLWRVKIDPSQIDQMLVDLTTNARDAIVGSGKITIETSNAVVSKASYDSATGIPPGQFVLIKVTDTGCGMTQEVLNNVFNPFFTTKEIGQGTGLGLATLYGIVTENHGFVQVHSEPGRGATFLIYLPRCADEPVEGSAESSTKPPAVIPQGRRETVLIVEDQDEFLSLGMTILEELGYTVLGANSPYRALSIAAENKGNIDLLLIDVILPDMNGRELATRLCSAHPALKCLFMSCYPAELVAQRGLLLNELVFIRKPFSMNELATKIRSVLDRAEAVDPMQI